jgi:hypothetical protein
MFGFVSKLSADVYFNPNINGLHACYIRRAKFDGVFESKTKKMLVMLQRSFQAHDDGAVEIGARTTFIWVRTKDMVFDDGEIIIPENDKDEIAVDALGELQVYKVSAKGDLRMPSQFGGMSIFGHEDGLKTIMTIKVVRIR